ncbi:hypothetical protein B5F40_10095 [Gordonibacter sp. An230]|nr:hypothetical protein B5F40_10095 [Gordonibacter sp. An230]
MKGWGSPNLAARSFFAVEPLLACRRMASFASSRVDRKRKVEGFRAMPAESIADIAARGVLPLFSGCCVLDGASALSIGLRLEAREARALCRLASDSKSAGEAFNHW